ncbi:MAG TPA: hybrid sensor histidine kinase/response regulator, partial [Syntrophus sp. (in: bacteria)]|nr:hybrid sensor histidine kinase/response regulator [Syntrophus sp. (in: bacteria)]
LIVEERFTLPSGEVRFYQTTKMPLTGNGNVDTSILGISMDLTPRKQMEEELLRVQKLESLGILAGGIAHDFNNMMVAVQGYIDLSLLQLSSDQKAYKYLGTARQCMAQAGELTSRLITFSRGDFPFRKSCDVENLIRDAVRRMVREGNINISFDFGDDLWPAEIDELQIRQVFYNLTTNAMEAMPEGGTILIRGTNAGIQGDDVLPLKKGPYLKITFADEGIGIPEENLVKVFDPYFSTKEVGSQRGMGLGLSVCYSVLKKHAGYIKIDSQPGKGTEVTLYLPAEAGQAKEGGEILPGGDI